MHKYVGKLVGAAALLSTAAMIASAAPASATVVGPPVTSNHLGGYAGAKANVHLNENRSNTTLPDLTGSGVTADRIGSGVTIQQGPGGGETLAAAWVWNDTSSGCSSTQWALEEGAQSEPSQTPIPPAGGLTPIMVGSPLHGICANGGATAFIGVHWSTARRQFAVLYAPIEANNVTIFEEFVSFHGNFLEAGTGVTTTDGVNAAALPSGKVFGYTRNGLTEPAGFNFGGKAGTRVTLNAFNLTQFLGTESGGAKTPSNPATLQPSAPGVGSAFTVTVP
jgi:hypothetical protein